MSIQTIAPATLPQPPYGPAYQEGRLDAATETRDVMATRIAWARDHAAQAWADDYAAGALDTYLTLDRLTAHLAAMGAQS